MILRALQGKLLWDGVMTTHPRYHSYYTTTTLYYYESTTTPQYRTNTYPTYHKSMI